MPTGNWSNHGKMVKDSHSLFEVLVLRTRTSVLAIPPCLYKIQYVCMIFSIKPA
jgi:hypothetical protein